MTTPVRWQPGLIAVDIDGTLALEGRHHTDVRNIGTEAISDPVRAALADAVAVAVAASAQVACAPGAP